MSGYLQYEAHKARLDDLHRHAAQARRARRPAAVEPRMESRRTLLTTLREALG
jgi:hypothetical protein